ncbi:MAG: hypothetical protein KGI33_08920 [Thaumarchaeota archaeon]|nr:hypothetical protein [Nitrososphaerota archaeon]
MSGIISKKCEKCGANMIGCDWITKHVHGVLGAGKDPRTATGRQNTLNQVKGLHKSFNELKDPCNYCISTYSKMIDEAVGSYKRNG